ncbi:MAG: calcium-binding protein [Hyphomicrobiales bacterium]|nr:MAG: calcium-binding protein [Hyphomicrobiales bacterium]
MAFIIGTSGPDTIIGMDDDDDRILGLGGDDHLIGLNGNDGLLGGPGADLLEGGEGDDTYELNADRSDAIIDLSGWDTIRATTSLDLADYPEIENLVMATEASGREALGNALNNEIFDRGGSNILDGREGQDYLVAGGGDDVLIGGLGVDYLQGGSGDDRFDFHDVAETGVGSGPGIYRRDQIMDFTDGDDLIHLGGIDADARHSGNQGFRFLGATSFTGSAGELVTYEELINTGTETVTVIAGDTDGDGVADFEIELRGSIGLSAGDFIL